ncbi:hypothetical protein SKB0068_00290 [Staphylococcus hominis subsp. novobiosepticus]|uniref:hypothetical protein n=1 Tax=Staphylococcus hominis TaxID=1290 RepID=UPI0030173A87
MARTYNAIKYVIKKNKDDLKIHGLRLYEFNIKDERAINISQPIFVNRTTLIEKIQNGEAFIRAFRVSQNDYYAGQSIALSINKNGYINNSFDASRDVIRNIEVSILDYR